MTYDYPDDGHIYVCVRVRDVAKVPGMVVSPSATRHAAVAAQRICVSTLENVLVLHDPRAMDDASCVARDADGVVQFLTNRSSGIAGKHLSRKLLTSTSTASYFEFDKCLNSMDASSMLQMPLVLNSDFIQPPECGTQEDVYLCTAAHAVTAAVEGINSCVFAYGQTGSGKTFTLFGDVSCISREPGVVPRTIEDLFQRLNTIRRQHESDSETEYSCRVQLSFFEIYQNEVYCLFSRKGPLRVNFSRDATGKKEVMIIQDLQQQVVACAANAFPLVEMGLRRRQTGETGMNARSSRSHAILQVRVTQWRTNRLTKESVELDATINLVDLAGSERQKTAKTDGKSRDEGIQINQSLATLARVINEISRGAKYVNYRDSLLTMVLKDNLGGNSRTFMIATIAPVAFCYQESCATLQYAKDVRKIRNRPTVNKTFQTRSNLLELNAVLKKENERLKHHVESLLRGIDANAKDADGDAAAQGDEHFREKITGKALGCRAAGKDLATEAVIAAPAVGVAPLIITAHRMYTSLDGIGASCVEGGKIGITSLTKDVMQFRLADVLGTSWRNGRRFRPCQEKEEQQQQQQHHHHHLNGEEQGGIERDYGIVEFERMSHRSCEQRYWVRYIPREGGAADAAASQCEMDCQVNGTRLTDGDRRQLQHGDVLCIYLDNVDGSMAQSVLTFHYVDINCLSRRGSVGNVNTTGELRVAVSLPGTPTSRDEEVVQLRREKAKLLEMLQAQARVIEYQCQRDGESRSRVASLSNHHHRQRSNARGLVERDASSSPNPAAPLESIDPGVPATTTLLASAAAHAFYRTSASSPSMRYGQSVDPQHQDDGVHENRSLYKGMMERNATLEELARRLAELENSTSPLRNGPTLPAVPASLAKKMQLPQQGTDGSTDGDGEEEIGTDTEKTIREISDSSISELQAEMAAGKTGFEEPAPNADDILLKHRSDRGLDEFNMMHVYLSTSEGVRERYRCAKRERVLCERIWSLEQALEDLREEVHLLESKLRISQDAATEYGLRQAQMEDEMTEVSRALLESTEENAALLREVNSLETFLHRTEEALAEATTVNEAELEKRLKHMAEEIQALRTLACMWKRRAMQRIALEFSDNNRDDSGEVVNKSGQVPWDELRVESNAARAKQLLGERRCTAFAAGAIDRFEKETAVEAVVALETVLAQLESENLRLIDEIKTYEEQLQSYKDLVTRLRREKEQLEKEDLAQRSATVEEAQKFKALYSRKCEELAAAERNCETAATKLQTALKKNTVVKSKSVKSNDLLLQEQRRIIEEQQAEHGKLIAALSEKDEELRNVLLFLQSRTDGAEINGFKDENELYERIEQLIDSAIGDCSGTGGYSAFPPDFQFSEELIALIRVSLRIMMDRLKVELYVLNRQSLHKFGLLVPAVQLRPEAQFHCFMHELRGVVAEVAGKPQRIGSKWTVQESDVLSRLVDYRRRHAGNALNGLLIWYDHWDLSPKSEHVCYMELIRNRDRVMQLARMVRQESLVNTNATSTLRLVMPGKNGGPDTTYVTSNGGKDNSIIESRRILEKLSIGAKRSNLARLVTSGKPLPVASANGFERSRTAITTSTSLHTTPRRSGLAATSGAGRLTAFSRRNTMTDPQQHQQHAEGKFGRRATALVVPVSENDVVFAASTALVRHDSTYNFNHRMNAVGKSEVEPSSSSSPIKLASKAARFARAKTDVPPSLATIAGTRNGKVDGATVMTPCHGAVTKETSVNGNQLLHGVKSNRRAVAGAASPPPPSSSSGDAFRRARTQFDRTNTMAVPQLSSRISGRCVTAATRTSIGSQINSPKPSVPTATTTTTTTTTTTKPFYDPSVLKTLKQRSTSESNRLSQKPKRSTTPTATQARHMTPTTLRMQTPVKGGTFSRTLSTLGCPPSLSKFQKSGVRASQEAAGGGGAAAKGAPETPSASSKQSAAPPVPRLYLDAITK